MRPRHSRASHLGLIVAVLALVSSCRSTPGPTPGSSPTASPAPQPKPRAVVVAWQGARADWISQYQADGLLPNLAALAKRGFAAQYLSPAEPSLASASFFMLSTGKYPLKNGLDSPVTPPVELGRPEADSHTEPVWRTAMRSGLLTAALFWPAATLDNPAQYADLVIATRESGIPGAVHSLVLSDTVEWQGSPPTFSPPRQAALTLHSSAGNPALTLRVLALDTTDDGQTSYDQLVLDDDADPDNGSVRVNLGQWTTVPTSPRLHSSLRLLFSSSTGLTITLYTSQSVYSQARPDQLLRDVNREFGAPPPPPDLAALNAGWINPEQYLAMALDRERWVDEVTLYVYSKYAPELLLTSRGLIADCARAFLLVDGRQTGYGPERAEAFAGYLKRAHITLDDALGDLLNQVSLVNSSVFVVSPNGYLPAHTTVNVNTILAGAKLQSVKTGGVPSLDLAKTKAWAATNEGLAHVYINLQGREESGIVAPDSYAKVQEQVMAALSAVRDEANQPFFARVAKREDLSPFDLGTADAGDVVAQAAPGYVLSDGLGVKQVEAPSAVFAAQGYASSIPEMRGILVAAGGRLASGSVSVPVSLLDIGPTICQALDVRIPVGLDGSVIPNIWR